VTSISPERVYEVWLEALSFAFLLAKGARAAELRGDRRSKTFDPRGMHPYSEEWGKVRACEELIPELETLRADADAVSMRATAFREAEDDFAADALKGQIDWHRG